MILFEVKYDILKMTPALGSILGREKSRKKRSNREHITGQPRESQYNDQRRTTGLPFTLLRRPSSTARRQHQDSGGVASACSMPVWLHGMEEEAGRIWSLGKDLGASTKGNDEEIVRKLLSMEQRDAQEAGEVVGDAPPRGTVSLP